MPSVAPTSAVQAERPPVSNGAMPSFAGLSSSPIPPPMQPRPMAPQMPIPPPMRPRPMVPQMPVPPSMPVPPPMMSAPPPSYAQALSVYDEPALEIDSLCLQFANVTGFLRVRFHPGAGTDGCDNVTLTLCDQATNWRGDVCKDQWCNRPREFKVLIPPHPAGPVVFDISLSYEKNGKRKKLSGDWATVSVGKGEERRAAENLVVNITTNITGGHASEIHNSTMARDSLKKALSGDEDVSERLRDIVNGSARAYGRIDLFGDGMSSLPPQPPQAKVDRLMLDLGAQRLYFFSSPTVTFGRRREWCDIVWRHPMADQLDRNDLAHNDYKKISRRQCMFEHRGDKVALIDGGRDEKGRITPSSNGTFFNAVRIEGEKLLSAEDGTGTGLITFSDSAATGTLSVCLPGDVCAKCTRADRRWCASGKRPSLVFKRLDGAPETSVMVWSCFRLEEVAPSFEGTKVFRENGGFAWRRGRYSGWLVPGETIETDVGLVRVLALPSPAELEKEKNAAASTTRTFFN